MSFMARVNVTERRLPEYLGPMEIIRVRARQGAEKCRDRYQPTILKPSIFSFLIATSLVTRVAPRASAWAAIMMSKAPALRPRRWHRHGFGHEPRRPLIPRMDRYPREERTYRRHDRWVILSKARAP